MRRVALICAACLFGASARAATFEDDVASLSGREATNQGRAVEHLQQGGRDAIPALLKGLDGASREVKLKLLDVLFSVTTSRKGFVAVEKDTRELARLARAEADRSVRYRMIEGVCNLGGEASVVELKRFGSEDSEELIRAEATSFVARASGKDARFFKKQFGDPSRRVRLIAAFYLARLGDKSGRELSLQTLKETASEDERMQAIATLGEIGATDDRALLDRISISSTEPYSMRRRAANAAMTIGLLRISDDNRLAYLMKSLDDPDAGVRDWAYSRLWNLPDAATSVRLRAYLAEPGHKGYEEASKALDSR